MKYTYEIITRDSKFIIQESINSYPSARHSLNKIIRIKNNPNDMCFQKESLLRAMKWLQQYHSELLL